MGDDVQAATDSLQGCNMVRTGTQTVSCAPLGFPRLPLVSPTPTHRTVP